MSYKEPPSGKQSSESSPCRAGCGHAEGDPAPEGAQKGRSQVGGAQREAVLMQAQPG